MKTLSILLIALSLPFSVISCGSDESSDLAQDVPTRDRWSSPQDEKLFKYLETNRAASNAEWDCLNQGASPDARNPITRFNGDVVSGDRPIINYAAEYEAVNARDFEWVRMLLGWGADPDAVLMYWQSTALHIVVDPQHLGKENRLEVVKQLLAFGADASLKDKDGRTPLDIAKLKLGDDRDDSPTQKAIVGLLEQAMKKTTEERQADRLKALKAEIKDERKFEKILEKKKAYLMNLIGALEKAAAKSKGLNSDLPYIVGVVIAGPDAELDDGYEKISGNLNANTKRAGRELYLYAKRGKVNPITDFDVSAADSREKITIPKGFTKIDVDLNQGAGGNFIYMSYTTDAKFGEPVKDVIVLQHKNAEFAKKQLPKGYLMIDVDLNAKAGGDFIFLGFGR